MTRVGLSPRVKKLTASVRSLHTLSVIRTVLARKPQKNNTNPPDRLTARFKKRLRAPANYRQNPISNFPENGGPITIGLTTLGRGEFLKSAEKKNSSFRCKMKISAKYRPSTAAEKIGTAFENVFVSRICSAGRLMCTSA